MTPMPRGPFCGEKSDYSAAQPAPSKWLQLTKIAEQDLIDIWNNKTVAEYLGSDYEHIGHQPVTLAYRDGTASKLLCSIPRTKSMG